VILALVFGGSAAIGISSLRNQEPAQPPPKVETVSVLVAAHDIPSFTLVTPEMIEARDFPKDLVPADALSRNDDALDRAVLNPIVKGEVILGGKLAPRGAGRGMAAKLKKGMRAFTINTPTVEAGVAGFILPGSKVDVLVTIDGQGNQDHSTVTLLQNVEILAVEQRVVAPAESKVDINQVKSVTVEVTPQEAARLTLGQTKGKLALSLRPLNDDTTALTRPVHISQLLGEMPRERPKEASRPVIVEPPPPLRIRTARGTFEGTIFFPNSAPPVAKAEGAPPAKAEGTPATH
jgi:pilus assembly protein CpaB